MALHRQVFFIGGFDPKSARQYHRMYREASARRPATAAGERVQVGPRESVSPLLDAWSVDWQAPDAASLQTRYAVMRWDDIVRRHWPRRPARIARDYLNVYLRAGAQGMFQRIWRGSRTACWLALWPLGIGLGLMLASLLLGALLAGTGALSAAVALSAAFALGLLVWRVVARRWDSEWLLRLYGFTWYQASGQLPDLEERLDALAAEVVRCAEADDAREILLVGHSTGAIMASIVLARALARAPWLGERGPALGLLTLGHCVPVLAWLRQAAAYRTELARLANHSALTWLDFSAPADWAAFAQVPPWLQPGRARLWQGSPRFHLTLDADAYQALLANRHALHMQYLRSPQRAGGYDPVELTAGPLLFAERHALLTPPRP